MDTFSLQVALWQLDKSSSYVFPGKNGPLTTKNIQKIVRLAAKKANIRKKVTPHKTLQGRGPSSSDLNIYSGE